MDNIEELQKNITELSDDVAPEEIDKLFDILCPALSIINKVTSPVDIIKKSNTYW